MTNLANGKLLTYESGLTRSNMVTATIMAVPGAINDIASVENAGRVITSKVAGIGGGMAAAGFADLAIAGLTGGAALGPVGMVAGVGVGLVAAAIASGYAEELGGKIWDGIFG